MTKIIRIISLCLLLSACRLPDHFGFYQPITMRIEAPDGSPEYKAGWHAGCRSGLASKVYANAWVYEKESGTPDVGSGIYQHDKAFQLGFGQALWACYTQALTFTYHHSMRDGPLE